MPESVFIVDIMRDVVKATSDALISNPPAGYPAMAINYTYGDKDEITGKMRKLVEANETKYLSFPFFGITMPFDETLGVTGQFYGQVVFPEIIIAQRSSESDDFPTRYETVIKPVLYPIFEQFLIQISRSPKFNGVREKRNIQFRKRDVPNCVPLNSGLNEYVDAIILNNLSLTINQNIC